MIKDNDDEVAALPHYIARFTYDLPANRYRSVDFKNRDELELWHSYDDRIATDNTGISPDWPLQEGSYDKGTVEFLTARREEEVSTYSKHCMRYFILFEGQVAGIFSLPRDWLPHQLLLIQSLYVLPDFRNQGLARQVLEDLYGLALSVGVQGIRLQTEYPWRSAVRFYLHNRYWLQHWNNCLNFIRSKNLPEHQVKEDGSCLRFCANKEGHWRTLISARNDGEVLCWESHKIAGIDGDILLAATTTLSLHLAVRGWPLVRSGNHDWRDGDCGGPEALAKQIAFWECPISELGEWKEHIEKLNEIESNRRQR